MGHTWQAVTVLQNVFGSGCPKIGLVNACVWDENSSKNSSCPAPYYDLIVGLHSDKATRNVVKSSLVRPTILIPCCNFWSERKLGRDELVQSIADFYRANNLKFETVVFPFTGPKNIGLVYQPPTPQSPQIRKSEGSKEVP
jgi:hypothetical protein